MDKNFYDFPRNLQATSPQMLKEPDSNTEGLEQIPCTSLDISPNPRLVAMTEPDSVGAEKFRVLAARLQYFRKQRQIRRIVITSSIKGEGKSLISANLALTLAQRHRTLLIDGDLRQSGLNVLFGTDGLPGLTDWWQEKTDITDFLKRMNPIPLRYLPSGQAAGQPLEILQSRRMSEFLAQAIEWFDWIVIDSPPLVPVADPNVWATQADGTLLVVEQGKTPKKLLQKTLESIENLKLIGVVVNASQDEGHQYYRQYHKYPKNVRAAMPEGQALIQG